MTEAGRAAIELAKANGSWNSLDLVDALVMPDDLAAALAALDGARDRFDGSSVSLRKMVLAYVYQAKRPATRAARVEKIATGLGRGESLATILQMRRD